MIAIGHLEGVMLPRVMGPTITKPHFSGHETFALRYTWLKKGLDAVEEKPTIFSHPEALVRLGVGKNMVRSIRHWGLAVGTLEDVPGSRGRELKPTEFGTALLANDGWDPYLEDSASLWLIHWRLASRPGKATTWYWLFNQQPSPDFTVDSVVQSLVRLAKENGWPKVTPSSLRRDIDCCVRTYFSGRRTARAVIEDTLDCPLSELKLVCEGKVKKSYILARATRASLPPEVFGLALSEYAISRGPATSIPLDDLMYRPGTPGRVFGLDEGALIRKVEELAKLAESVVFDETAGLKQVRVSEKFDARKLLDSMYKARGSGRSAA